MLDIFFGSVRIEKKTTLFPRRMPQKKAEEFVRNALAELNA